MKLRPTHPPRPAAVVNSRGIQRATAVIRKTMFAGGFAAEFRFDPQATPPYQFTIRDRDSGVVVFKGEESSVPDAMRTALESLELFNAEKSGQLAS